jgi:phage repressor protein C with HTH and peptisase S24 domain
LPYFPDLRIACGHFRSGRTDVERTIPVPPGHGAVDPSRHFVARATGNSMDGGKHPVRDGDYLLLELVDSDKTGSITGDVMAIERQDASGDDQYVLRLVTKRPDGRYVLKAANPDYPDFEANDEMRPLARLRGVWSEDG